MKLFSWPRLEQASAVAVFIHATAGLVLGGPAESHSRLAIAGMKRKHLSRFDSGNKSAQNVCLSASALLCGAENEARIFHG